MSQDLKEMSVRKLLPISILILALMLLPYVIVLQEIIKKDTLKELKQKTKSVKLQSQKGVYLL